MKASHAKILKLLREGNSLVRDEHSCSHMYYIKPPQGPHWRSLGQVRRQTVTEMLRLGLLRHTSTGNLSYCPARQDNK